MEKLMTRKEMILYCLHDQKKRGLVCVQTNEQIEYQLKCRLSARPGIGMSWYDCKRWYDEVKAKEADR